MILWSSVQKGGHVRFLNGYDSVLRSTVWNFLILCVVPNTSGWKTTGNSGGGGGFQEKGMASMMGVLQVNTSTTPGIRTDDEEVIFGRRIGLGGLVT